MDLLRIEQQRQALEENLQELRRSLKYWQTFEAEYEGLKEEIVEHGEQDVGRAKLDEIAKTYDGALVNEGVVRELAGLDKKGVPLRSAQQIVRDIERRLEYVQKNVETIQRRFFGAEAKLEEFDFAARRESEGEDMLPLTEIIEELDDDDNVIMSRLVQPEKSQAKLVDSLRKAGLTDEDLEGGNMSEEKPPKPAITNAFSPVQTVAPHVEKHGHSTLDISAANGDSTNNEPTSHRPPLRKKSVSFAADTKSAPEVVRIDSEDGKKSVSFAEKVAIAPAAPLPDTRTVQFSPQVEEIPPQPLGPSSPDVSAKPRAQVDSDLQKELRASFKPGDRVKVLNDDDEVVHEQIVIPENESEEDAQTRREMLDYHLHEVGHVVAQMNLHEDDDDDEDNDDDTSSHITSSTYLDDEDTPYTSGLSEDDDDEEDEDEDEDEYGRTKGKIVSDKYRKEMMEMQKRLIGNLGPAPKDDDLHNLDSQLNPEDVRRLVIREKRNSTSSIASDSSDKKAKKRVSFAESLDVALPDSPPLKARKHVDGETVPPVSDLMPDHSMGVTQTLIPPGAPARTSTFKQYRSMQATGRLDMNANLIDLDGTSDSPSGPPGCVLADNLIERPRSSKLTSAPASDEPDPVTERRQLAAEYYRRRNEIVRQQGGFKVNRDEDEEMGELMEERPDGTLKKVSRFKAARIQPHLPLS